MSVKILLGTLLFPRRFGTTEGVSFSDEKGNSVVIDLIPGFEEPFTGNKLTEEEIINLIKLLMGQVSFNNKKILADYAKQLDKNNDAKI